MDEYVSITSDICLKSMAYEEYMSCFKDDILKTNCLRLMLKIIGGGMDFKISSVKIECDKGRVLIPFSDSVTFFYGNTGVGKTTLLNLINFALGQDLVNTQIVDKEVNGVCVDAFVCKRRLSIERKVSSNMITVKEENEVRIFLAKGDSNSRATFSDYLYKLIGLEPIERLQGKSSKSIRVSFANFMWYAYLRQDELDNTLFYLGEQNGNYKKYASNYVMRSLLNETKIIEKEILQEIYKLSEKQEVAQAKLAVIKEVLDESVIFEINIDDEIEKKYNMLGEVNQKIERALKFEGDNNEERIKKIAEWSKVFGRYEAEIRYLNEFRKINKLKEKYNIIIQKYNQEKVEHQAKLRAIHKEPFKKNIDCLEVLFKRSLLDVGFPNFSEEEIVRIDTSSFLPAVYDSIGNFRFDYYNLSSSGIRTIFKICYTLSIYQYVRERKISSLLPTFIMIDTPMKNISERIDEKIYMNLYDYFYRLFSKGGELFGIQLIIIDKEKPKIFEKNKVACRMFTKENPLIPLSMLEK